ncbi:MAG: hypothetical protein PHF79_01245, partial [Candidatus Pacebacteria bacterium]|nr:hypothetical protein [Candidatus Paceibacterota bacterium]
SLVYKSPDYVAFCPNNQIIQPANTQAECVAQGGQWNGNVAPAAAPKSDISTPVEPAGYCNLNYTCQNNYDAASKTYERNVFITLVILGAISLVAGILLSANAVVSLGLAYGGVLSFIIASARYWSSADNLIKVIILFIALALLIGVAIKKFKE